MIIHDKVLRPYQNQLQVQLDWEMLRIKAIVTPDPIKQKQREAQAKARQEN